jgi:acyl-CoA synthetase (AMP-forming)/AMP-acid ligase II
MKTESKSPDSLFMKIGGEGFDYKVLENQLFIKSDTSMVGYLNSENSFDEDGYFPTGDIVEQDEDGYLRIVGRIKEFINIGGQKVTPSEVEGVILEISEILDVIVKGEKNAIMGEMVVAYVVIDKNINQFEIKEKILEKCKASLESYKVPVKVKFLEKIIFSERFKKSRLINLEETS